MSHEKIKKIEELLNKYYDALESNNLINQEKIYKKFVLLKKELKPELGSLSDFDKKTYKLVCSEFRIMSNADKRNKLFEGIVKSNSKRKTLRTNDDYLTEAKQTSTSTTLVLKKSLQEIEEAKEIGDEAIKIMVIDEEKFKKINIKIDEIDSDSKIAMKLMTRFVKRFYTDKLIMLFTFIVISLITIIILFKYKIIT